MFTDNREQQEFAKQWGYLAGLWHDLGKFSQRFQNRLSGENLRVDHATKGAQELAKLNFPWGHLLAYGVAGHHSGLLDAESNFSCQKKRLTSKTLEEIPSAPSFLLTFELPPPPKSLFEGLRSHSHLPFLPLSLFLQNTPPQTRPLLPSFPAALRLFSRNHVGSTITPSTTFPVSIPTTVMSPYLRFNLMLQFHPRHFSMLPVQISLLYLKTAVSYLLP